MSTYTEKLEDLRNCYAIAIRKIDQVCGPLTERERTIVKQSLVIAFNIVEEQTVCLTSEQNPPSSPK